MIASKFLKRVTESYFKKTPTAGRVFEELAKAGEAARNDHVAFRSFGADGLGVSCVEGVFLSAGYKRMNELYFPEKKIRAHWYKPPAEDMARVFISELMVKELSPSAQEILGKYLSKADPATPTYGALASALDVRPWPTPSLEDYNLLATESEYASWTLVNAYIINHVTISVHSMNTIKTLPDLNTFLKTKGFVLNNSSGEIKTSPDGLLRQSSTVADKVSMTFADGETRSVPGSYIEFAERLVLPEFATLRPEEVTERHRRDGFEVANADKIFESTFEKQTSRAAA